MGKLGYLASANTVKSNRFLDQVSSENFHNGGNSERAFSRFDYQLTPRDQLRANLLAGRSSFELTAQLFSNPGDTPVTPSQERHLTTVTTANRINWLHGRHNFRAGFDFQHFPVSENFTFGVTDPNFKSTGFGHLHPDLCGLRSQPRR